MRDDETLIRGSQAGDTGAIETLFRRYQKPLWDYAWRLSWLRDKSFIDDIRQRVFLIILKGLKNGKFTSAGKGSFKKWAYTICKNICLDENQKARRRERPLSERYPEELPGHLTVVRPESREYYKPRARLYEVLTKVSPEERQLILLLKEDKTYKEIQKIPPFNKYSLPTLRQKVCRTRRFLINLIKELRNDNKNK